MQSAPRKDTVHPFAHRFYSKYNGFWNYEIASKFPPFILKYNSTTQNPADLISNWLLRRIAKRLHVAYRMFCKQTRVTKKFLPVFHWSKTMLNRQQQHDAYQLTHISAATRSSEILSADGLFWTDRPASLTADHMAIVRAMGNLLCLNQSINHGRYLPTRPGPFRECAFPSSLALLRDQTLHWNVWKTPSNSFQVFTLH
jgi:hypothetical protein